MIYPCLSDGSKDHRVWKGSWECLRKRRNSVLSLGGLPTVTISYDTVWSAKDMRDILVWGARWLDEVGHAEITFIFKKIVIASIYTVKNTYLWINEPKHKYFISSIKRNQFVVFEILPVQTDIELM